MNSCGESYSRLPELRELVRCARAYDASDIHFSYVCCAAAAFGEAAKFYETDERIRQMGKEWVEMATRVWPEWAPIDNPISEAEFKFWVHQQLVAFEPVDIA